MPVIELDMLIAYVNKADELHSVAVKIFNAIVNRKLKNIGVPSSAYLEYELVLKSKGYDDESISKDIQAFKNIKNLEEIPLSSNVIIEASRLRQTYKLTYFDSLHAASALLFDGKIISTDNAYRRVFELEVIDPKEIM